MIAEGEVRCGFDLHSFGAFWFHFSVVDAGGVRKKLLVLESGVRSHTYPPGLSSVPVCFSLSCFLCPWLKRFYLLRGFRAREGTQLHRCAAWLAFLFFFLHMPGAANPPGPPALMKSCRGSIWQLLIRHGVSVPRRLTPSPLSLILSVSLWNKGSCQEGESIIALARGATFNVSTQMEKRAQHNKSATMKGPSLPLHHPLKNYDGSTQTNLSFWLSITPGACWKIIYCTRRWLTTRKLGLRACLISPPPET